LYAEFVQITADLLKLIIVGISCHIGRREGYVLRIFESRLHYDWDWRVLWFNDDD